jgi:hypothetical protein
MQSSAEQGVSIDLNDVKPGDTVTLEADGGRKVTAPRSERTLPDYAPGTWFLDVYPDGDPVPFSAAHWTLTDHQPAPEWRPGQFVSGVVEGARRQGMVDDLGNFLFWNHESEGEQEEPIAPGVVTDVRPLAVLDPATVDVESIGAALSEVTDVRPDLSWEEIARIALAEVGIEVPR